MTETHERLSYYIDYKGYSLKEFCAKFDFVYNTFTQIASGTRPLGINILNKIVSSLPDLNVNWLLYGKGSMELSASQDLILVQEPAESYDIADPVKDMFLKYLDDRSVQDKIRLILNSSTKKGK